MKLQFSPQLTPKEMLDLGVFGGNYFPHIPEEFPAEWFSNARLSSDGKAHSELNFFEVVASQPRSVWLAKGWIDEVDPLGWFQWYCRYFQGRRIPEIDNKQIKRWKAMRRHIAQITKNCQKQDLTCRRRQRQALLHWAYDSRKI